jgi:uridine kinase
MQLILIAGGSGSGKSTLANKLFLTMKNQHFSVCLISMDDYYLEVPDDVTDINHFRQTENFDQIEKYDLTLLTNHLELLNQGLSVEKPIFDFPTNKRLTSEIINPCDFLIIEGLFALSYGKMLSNSFKKTTVYVGKTSYLDLINTRIKRDGEERALSPEHVKLKERKTVGAAFFFEICKSKSGVDFDISNDAFFEGEIHPLDIAVNDIIWHLDDRTPAFKR